MKANLFAIVAATCLGAGMGALFDGIEDAHAEAMSKRQTVVAVLPQPLRQAIEDFLSESVCAQANAKLGRNDCTLHSVGDVNLRWGIEEATGEIRVRAFTSFAIPGSWQAAPPDSDG
jgi:hypothetical protein